MTQNSNGTGPLPLLNEKNPILLSLNAGIAPEIGCWILMGKEVDFTRADYENFTMFSQTDVF